MQKVITRPQIKLPLRKTNQEILRIWKAVKGIWRKKKTSPLLYLEKSRKEWKKRTF